MAYNSHFSHSPRPTGNTPLRSSDDLKRKRIDDYQAKENPFLSWNKADLINYAIALETRLASCSGGTQIGDRQGSSDTVGSGSGWRIQKDFPQNGGGPVFAPPPRTPPKFKDDRVIEYPEDENGNQYQEEKDEKKSSLCKEYKFRGPYLIEGKIIDFKEDDSSQEATFSIKDSSNGKNVTFVLGVASAETPGSTSYTERQYNELYGAYKNQTGGLIVDIKIYYLEVFYCNSTPLNNIILYYEIKTTGLNEASEEITDRINSENPPNSNDSPGGVTVEKDGKIEPRCNRLKYYGPYFTGEPHNRLSKSSSGFHIDSGATLAEPNIPPSEFVQENLKLQLFKYNKNKNGEIISPGIAGIKSKEWANLNKAFIKGNYAYLDCTFLVIFNCNDEFVNCMLLDYKVYDSSRKLVAQSD